MRVDCKYLGGNSVKTNTIVFVLKESHEGSNQKTFALLGWNPIIITRGTTIDISIFKGDGQSDLHAISLKIKVANVAINSKWKHGEESVKVKIQTLN